MSFPHPKWKWRVSHISGRNATETALYELDEMEAELRKLQAVCQRMRRAVRNGAANPYPAVPETNQILLAMDGWTVSLVESYFALFKILRGSHELHMVMTRWARNIYDFQAEADAKKAEYEKKIGIRDSTGRITRPGYCP